MADIPEELLERSKAAKAAALAALGGGGGDDAAAEASDAAEAAVPAEAARAAAPVPAAPAAVGPARTQRLLAVVKAGSIQQTKRDPVDKVNTWPHLLSRELVAMMLCTLFLMAMSLIINAPLQEAANFNQTPNPSKAPWYFLGLQELLTLYDPMVAGVLIPGIGLAGLAAFPYLDRNPSTKPSERKFAISFFTMFMVSSAILSLFSIFFRGPGFNFVWPWDGGVFFEF